MQGIPEFLLHQMEFLFSWKAEPSVRTSPQHLAVVSGAMVEHTYGQPDDDIRDKILLTLNPFLQ